jgi:hypothetical protein
VPIGHWPPRRIARVWFIAFCIEAVLVLVPLVWGQLAPKEPVSPGQRNLEAFMARMDSVDRGLLPAPPSLSDSQRVALGRFVRDSLGFEFVQRGQTTDVIALTPEARAASESFGRGMRHLGDAIARAVFMLALLYLPIPLALLGMTTVWLWQRRRLTVSAADV